MRYFILIAAFFLACAGTGIREGTVVSKSYTPASFYNTYQSVVIDGQIVQIPTQHYLPERYSVRIRKYNRVLKENEFNTIDVDRDVYERLREGEWVQFR